MSTNFSVCLSCLQEPSNENVCCWHGYVKLQCVDHQLLLEFFNRNLNYLTPGFEIQVCNCIIRLTLLKSLQSRQRQQLICNSKICSSSTVLLKVFFVSAETMIGPQFKTLVCHIEWLHKLIISKQRNVTISRTSFLVYALSDIRIKSPTTGTETSSYLHAKSIATRPTS